MHLALSSSGMLTGWGRSDGGQIAIPSGVNGNVKAITAGNGISMLITNDGDVHVMGRDDGGQLTIPNDLGEVVSVSVGIFPMALTVDGQVYVWGTGSNGDTNLNSNLPNNLTDIVSIAAGNFHSIAVNSSGQIFSWGATSSQAQNNLPIDETFLVLNACDCDGNVDLGCGCGEDGLVQHFLCDGTFRPETKGCLTISSRYVGIVT